MEGRIDRGELATSARARGVATFAQLIDLHVADMKEVGKAPGRSKEATLAMLQRELGSVKMTRIDRDCLVQFGRKRAPQGAGPVTLSMDIGAIRLVLAHAAAVHGLPVSVEQVDLGCIALKRLGLVGKSNQRDRRPTDEELARLIAHFDANPRQLIPWAGSSSSPSPRLLQQDEGRGGISSPNHEVVRGAKMGPIAEVAFDLSYTLEKMGVRLYAPEPVADSSDWACTFEIDEPLALRRTLYGVSSMQALLLALKSLSSNLYGSDVYRSGQLGIYGEFGGDLAIPATSLFLDMAPYPF